MDCALLFQEAVFCGIAERERFGTWLFKLKGLASRECAGSRESFLKIIARFNRYKLDGCKNFTQDSLMPAWMRQMPLSAVI